MKFNNNNLAQAFKDADIVANFKGGFDTFLFRKSFEQSDFSTSEKSAILDYIKNNLSKNSFLAVKEEINRNEFDTSEYYSSPKTCRNIIRNPYKATSPTIYKTFAGLMELSLVQQLEQ